MPKTTVNRRGRFIGQYRFAPSEPPDDSSDAATAARVTALTPKTGSKPRIKGHELVFLVNWLDLCISQGNDESFQETLVKEFQTRFGRVVNAKTAESKVVVYLQELAGRIGSKYVSKREVLSKGSRCIEWHRAPEELVFDYNNMRRELELPIIIADEAESMRNRLFRASESEADLDDESDSVRESASASAPISDSQVRSSTRPSPRQLQTSPIKINGTSTLAGKSTTTITTPVPGTARVESDDYESADENQDASETDSTVISKGQDDMDNIKANWHDDGDSYAGANEHQPDVRDRKINILSNMVSWLLQRHRDGWNGSEAELEKLESVRKEVVSERDYVFSSFLNELTGQAKKTTQLDTIVKSIIGEISVIQPEAVHAPQAPYTKAVDGVWKLLWERCRLLTRTIQQDRHFKAQDFERLYESIDITWQDDPHYRSVIWQSSKLPDMDCDEDILVKLHGCMARLLFIFVFEYPTPLLQDQHSDLLKHLYSMIGAAGDMSEVRRLDLLATEMLLKEDRIQNDVVHRKAEIRSSWISNMLGLNPAPDPYDTVFGDIRELCVRAIRLYSQLLASPLEYCIHFFPRGTLFDEPSMKVEDCNGTALPTSRCIGKTVKLCLFPAIWQYCDQPLNQSKDITDALTSSKKFLRTYMSEMNVHLSLVSKAIVLLEK